jgi:hypothetical protein
MLWEGLMVGVMGLDEMMFAGLREFVERSKSGSWENGVEVVELEGMWHVGFNIEPMFGYGRGRVVEEWVKEDVWGVIELNLEVSYS